MTTTILRSDDLSCPSCAAPLERALTTLDGVEGTRIHVTTGRIEVDHDPERAGVDRLIATLRDAGYGARRSPF